MFILVISSVRFEGFYQICFLIDSAFDKWQYFIFSLPLSLCKLMVLGPCNLCSNWSSDFDFNRRFGCKIFYFLCDWRCDVTTNCLTIYALTTPGGEFEFRFSTGIIFSSYRLLLANKI